LLESVEAALHLGKGKLALIDPESGDRLDFSSAWHCARCDASIRPPTPGSSASIMPWVPAGLAADLAGSSGSTTERALPDHALSIGAGVVKAFQGDTYHECQIDLERNARKRKIDLDTPFEDLSEKDQDWVIRGEGGDPEAAYESGQWYGVKGFFDWLETKTYKMHVRVFLSRFRSYTECRACDGKRLQPESLNYRVGERTLPELWHLPVCELLLGSAAWHYRRAMHRPSCCGTRSFPGSGIWKRSGSDISISTGPPAPSPAARCNGST